MAHEITKTDRYAEVRTGGQRAWHGLGEEIAEGMGAQEALEANNLDWTTSLHDVYCRTTVVGEDGMPVEKLISIPTHKLHVRDDNGAHLGMVGSGYSIFENKQVAQLADQLCGLDRAISVETIGSLRGGKRFFILCKLPNEIKAAANDPLAQYVLFSNGHGGSALFQAYPTSIRVVCANTLRWSERDVLKGCRFRHTGDLEMKIEDVRRALGIALKETESFEKQVQALSSKRVDTAGFAELFTNVYNATEEKLTPGNDERRAKILGEWVANLEDPRQLGGDTLWTGYNAISQWYDHERGRFKSLDESTSRAHSNLFGTTDKFKRRAYAQALALV